MPLVPNSEDAFAAIQTELLDDFEEWLGGQHRTGNDEAVGDVGVFLDWRYYYSTGVLDAYDEADIAEFLLGWCPRKLSVPPEDADGICRSVGVFVEFLAQTGRLAGGFDGAARLMTHTAELAPQMRTRMGDSANFGMAKSLFAGLDETGALTLDELQAAAQFRMDEFNALPFELRKELTDRFLDPQPEPIVLPFTYFPPTLAELDAAAATAALPRKVAALREYLGAGKALTQKGNIKLADGRALIELLDTGDRFDPEYGEATFKTTTTEHLGGLNFVVDVAKHAGAVRVYQRRLVPVKSWVRRSLVEQASELARLIVDVGPLSWRGSRYQSMFTVLAELLDDGIVHWLAPLLPRDSELDFGRIVELSSTVVDEMFDGADMSWMGSVGAITEHDISRILEALETAGVVEWDGKVNVPTRFDSDGYRAGGVIRLTALGRQVVADLVTEAGYVLHRVDDLVDADADTLIDALDSVPDYQHDAVFAAWQPARSSAERVEMIVATIADADTAKSRLIGFVVLERFAQDIVAPLVRQLLDSPAAGHAALWLVSHGLAEEKSVGDFIGVGVLVDVLAAALDDPGEMCQLFTGTLSTDELLGMLDDMWRHPGAETVEVLDALGAQLPDRKLAKAARKAAMQHRSWMANRR